VKKYNFKYGYVSLYVDKNNFLYAIPSGENKKLNINATIDILEILESPYTDDDIECFVYGMLELCYTKENEDINAPHPLENHFNAKKWKIATNNLKYINVNWEVNEGYEVRASKKEKDGSYSGINKQQLLGFNPQPGELARAIKQAIEDSTC